MMDKLKKLLSFLLGKPIFRGYGFTTGDDKVQTDPTIKDPQNLIFYQLRKDLGTFEIRRVKNKSSGQVAYVIFNSVDLLEFEVSKKWFDYLFEEVTNTTVIDFNS